MSRTMQASYVSSSKAEMANRANLRVEERGMSWTLESQSSTKIGPVGLMSVKVYNTTSDPNKNNPIAALNINGDLLDKVSYDRLQFLHLVEISEPSSNVYKASVAEVIYMELSSQDTNTYAVVWEFNGKVELHSLIATTGDGPIFDPPRSYELISMAGQGKFEATFDISAPL